ncbi:hypothetical protein N9L02_01070 [Gammaproteobacteria bacterium]|nr:hypothetical protein [Gammaproteobacteria bacterium]
MFVKQSADTAKVLASFLTVKSIINSSMTCFENNNLFKKPLANLKAQKLLQAVVYGEYYKVSEALNSNPELLLKRDTVIDYSGRIHKNKTALQLALGAGDTNVVRENKSIGQHGMVELIIDHFKKLPNFEIEIKQQYDEQFPCGFEEKESERLKYDKAAINTLYRAILKVSNYGCRLIDDLENIIHFKINTEYSKDAKEFKVIFNNILKAKSDDIFKDEFSQLIALIIKLKLISGDTFDFTLLEALYRFRNHFEPKDVKIYAKHFDIKIFDFVLLKYDSYYERLNQFGGLKNKFCWQKVVGYIQRFIPACDAYIIGQGVWNIIENKVDSSRIFKFRENGISYYPLNFTSRRGSLGFNYVLYPEPRFWAGSHASSHLIKNKAQSSLSVLMQQMESSSLNSNCVML